MSFAGFARPATNATRAILNSVFKIGMTIGVGNMDLDVSQNGTGVGKKQKNHAMKSLEAVSKTKVATRL